MSCRNLLWRRSEESPLLRRMRRTPRQQVGRWQVLLLVLFSLGLPLDNGLPSAFADDVVAPAIEGTATQEAVGEKLFAGGIPKGVAELRAMEEIQRRIGNKLIECTVNLRINSAQGSGVIISEDGYVLTAAHVAQRPDEKVVITLSDGRRVEGITLGLDRGSDAGLARITSPGKWPHMSMGSAKGLNEGQWCVATGHPGGLERERKPVIRVGRILAKSRDMLVTDCALVGGDSGGPLADGQGRIIGIHSRIGTQLTSNMHVPVDLYSDSWERLLASEAWGHLPGQTPFLGVQGEPEGTTAKVARVYSGTPAEKGGIKVGDWIVEFGGKPVTDFTSLANLVAERQAGDKVKIRLKRGEETVELEITMERRSN